MCNHLTGVSRLRYGKLPSLMPFLHLPVQSGSDTVLKAMNRQHGADSYLRLVDRLRDARPDLALSSDFIVGFPGESDEDFEATMRLVERVTFAQAFSFKYSPRPGTPAAGQRKQVKDEVKSERLSRLQDLLNQQAERFNEQTVGRRLGVLLERPGRHPGQLVGKSPYLQGRACSDRERCHRRSDRRRHHRTACSQPWRPTD